MNDQRINWNSAEKLLYISTIAGIRMPLNIHFNDPEMLFCPSIFRFSPNFCVYHVYALFYASFPLPHLSASTLVTAILHMQIEDILYCFQSATSPPIVSFRSLTYFVSVSFSLSLHLFAISAVHFYTGRNKTAPRENAGSVHHTFVQFFKHHVQSYCTYIYWHEYLMKINFTDFILRRRNYLYIN